MDKDNPYDEHGSSHINNDDYHPYDESNCIKKSKSDDRGTIVLIVGIVAILLSIPIAILGIPLSIVALVMGSKIKDSSNLGQAGWILGIIGIVVSSLSIIISFMIF